MMGPVLREKTNTFLLSFRIMIPELLKQLWLVFLTTYLEKVYIGVLMYTKIYLRTKYIYEQIFLNFFLTSYLCLCDLDGRSDRFRRGDH